MTRKFAWLLGAVMVASTAACGGGGGVSVEDFNGKLVDQLCANEVECKDSPSADVCAANVTSSSTESITLVADVKAGIIKYDDSIASKCIDELGTDPCLFDGAVDTAPDCNSVFVGTLTTGTACSIDQECVTGDGCEQTDTTCDRTSACCAGMCAEFVVPLPIGTACGSDTADCVTTAYCKLASETATTGTCAALIAGAGTACDTTELSCVPPLYCDLEGQFTATCKQPAASGATCDPMSELPCIDDSEYCDPTSLKCTTDAAVGAPCSDEIPCVGFASCISSVCVINPAVGSACSTDTDAPPCQGAASCSAAGKCTLDTGSTTPCTP